MDVASEEGQGTQVQIWLPFVVVTAAVADFKPDKVSSVLLLDDDDEWAQSFLSVLADAGIKASRQDKVGSLPDIDLLFVDEHSASFSMEDVLASVKKANLADKTIVLTAALNPERVTQYLNEGLRDVQSKPYRADEVAALLK
jgi:DNA-binding NtrC family response regulator